jgi:hypothetical protein
VKGRLGEYRFFSGSYFTDPQATEKILNDLGQIADN